MQNFFRESTLVALRELALRQAAHEVKHRMLSDESVSPLDLEIDEGRHKAHKILVHVTSDPQTAMVIRRAKRVSDFLGAECFAVAVEPSSDFTNLTDERRTAMHRHLNFARDLHIETRILEGEETARMLVDFARRNQITQIFLARPRGGTWLRRNLVQRIVGMAKDMQIVIVSERE